MGGSRWVQNTPSGCGNHFPTSRTIFQKMFLCWNVFLYFAKPSKGRIYIRYISASGKTPSAARHTIGCASPDDIDTNPGLSKTMTREASYWQNRFKTYSCHENQKGGPLWSGQSIILQMSTSSWITLFRIYIVGLMTISSGIFQPHRRINSATSSDIRIDTYTHILRNSKLKKKGKKFL